MIERVRANETGIENKKYKKYQVIEALKDKFMWACVTLILTANLVIGGLGVFSNLIISNFGFTVLQTQLLNIAQGGVTVSVMVGSAWLCTRFNQTCYVMMVRFPGQRSHKHYFDLTNNSSGMDCPTYRWHYRYIMRSTNSPKFGRHVDCLLLHSVFHGAR